MNIKKKQIGIINNLVTGIIIIILGFVISIGSLNLYKFIIKLFIYIFIILGVSNLINFLLNRKIVRNFQTLFIIFLNIIIGTILFIFPKISLSIIPFVFSIYLLFNSLVKLVNYLILKKVKLYSRFKELFFFLFFIILSFVFMIYPYDRLDIFVMIIGIYFIVVGFSKINDFLMDILPDNIKLKIKRRIKITLPVFLDAFIPQAVLKNINKINNLDDFNKYDTNLKILIHLSDYGVNQFGHMDIIIDGIIYSYGNYDRNSRKLFATLGDGVLFKTKNKKNYINFCLSHNRETIIEYGIKTTDKQMEKLNFQLNKVLNDSYKWYPPVVSKKNVKKLYYADKIYNATKASFYKFKGSKFETFFIVGTNCTYFINVLLENSIFIHLKLMGILSPGTYYEYLEENYNSKNSKIIYKKIYKNDNSGDVSDKN